MDSIPYRFHQFHYPQIGILALNSPHHWTNVVGEFIRPIVEGEADLIYYFCNHSGDSQPNFEFCFASKDYTRIEKKIEKSKLDMGVLSKEIPTNGKTIHTAFLGERWMAKERIMDTALVQERSELVLKFLHATSSLYVNSLIKDGSDWRLEINESKIDNPLGSHFESILHMVSNISQAQFDIFLYPNGCRTAWMPAPTALHTRCHL